MALEFLSDAATEDAELFIKLDLEGLHTLLQIVGNAIKATRDRAQATPTLEAQKESGATGSEAARAFRKVTVAFVFPWRDAPTDPNPN